MATVSEALAIAIQHLQAGRLQAAEQIYRQILAIQPNHADAIHLLGVIASQVGKHEVAVEYIQRAIGLEGNAAAFHFHLGEAYRALRRFPEAVACYRRALDLEPDLAEAHNNLGNSLKEQGKLDEAVACYRRALELKPDFAEVHNNLGIVFKDQGKLDEALACYRRALELKPDFAEAHYNLGNALKDQGKLDEAVACYRRAVELKPDFAAAHSNLVYTQVFCPGYDAQTLYEEHRRWNQQHAEPLGEVHPASSQRPLCPIAACGLAMSRRTFAAIRWDDSCCRCWNRTTTGALKSFATLRCASRTAMTDRCRAHADVWRDVLGLSDEQVAETIRQDRIDILVDLTMHMANNRLLVFARKPAPVQVTYLAYCGTTGLGTMDYRLTDPYLDPPGRDEQFYSEQSVHLPETYWCYRPADRDSAGQRPAGLDGRATSPSAV